MNSFGNIFRVQVFGESHGPLVGVTIDGVPAGIPLTAADFGPAMERRKGLGITGTTPRKESDIPVFRSGIYQDITTGTPLQLIFENANIRSQDYELQKNIPRPGHADWVAGQKFRGFNDIRGGGAFSARLTAGIVAAGVVAAKVLKAGGYAIDIRTAFREVGGKATVTEGMDYAREQKDSVGAVITCTITGVPAGWGEPFWNSVESVLAHAMFAIPAVKGIEFGAGFAAAGMTGREHNDAIIDENGTTRTNHAGGVVGGLTNGNPVIFSLVFKPTSSTPQPQESFNFATGQVESFSVKGRHDLCVALRAPVIIESMAAIVLLDLMMQQRAVYGQ